MASLLNPYGLDDKNNPSITLKKFSEPAETPKPKKQSLFSVEIEKIFKREGGYVNDPNDSGGETIYGIARKHNPSAWFNGRPTREQAKNIYQRDYWDAIKGDYLPPKVASVLFDHAVLSGPEQAIKDLNKVLGIETADVSQSVEAAWGKDENKLAEAITYRRLKLYDDIIQKQPNKLKFYRGWKIRAMFAFHESDTDPDIIGEQRVIEPSKKSLLSFDRSAMMTAPQQIRHINNMNYAIKSGVLFKGTSIMEERKQADEINRHRDSGNSDERTTRETNTG